MVEQETENIAETYRELATSNDGPGDLSVGREVLMTGLSENSFTDSPARIVTGFDGAKACPVILMPFEMSVKIQDMIKYERFVAKEQRESKFKLQAIRDLKVKVTREISRHNLNISIRKERLDQDRAVSVEEESRTVDRLQQEVMYLGMLAQNLTYRKEAIERNLVSRQEYQIEHYAAVAAYLEEAFVRAEAIQKANNKEDVLAPVLDLQEEYQKQVRSMQEQNGEPPAYVPLETGDAFMLEKELPLSPEQQLCIFARRDLRNANMRLEKAADQFEQAYDRREYEKDQNYEAYAKGQPVTDATEDEFDLRWVVQNREITRELMEAEEVVSRAKLAAKEAGLPLEDDYQSSCFADADEDGSYGYGYASTGGVDEKKALAEPMITLWMGHSTAANGLNPDFVEVSQADVDEWNSGQEVGIEDSGSCVAEGKWRKRIDTWERMRPRRASVG